MSYRPEIDGLRAIAILPVILFHAGFKVFSGGYIGVDVFFVISGYLISSNIILGLAKGNFSAPNFFENRARRVLPALFFMMLLCLPFSFFCLTPEEMKDFSQSLIAVTLFSSNIFFWIKGGYFDIASEFRPLLHTWSLAVEEQYYLFFPLFLLLSWKLGRARVLLFLAIIFIVSLCLAQWGSSVKPVPTFYLLPTRGWELLLGAFVAFSHDYSKEVRSSRFFNELGGLIGLLLIFWAIFNLNQNTPFPSLYTLIPTIGTVLILICAVDGTLVERMLRWKPLVFLGLISYSAYLWHQPMLAFSRNIANFEIESKLILLAICAISFVFAYFSWKFIETPFRDKLLISRPTFFKFAIFFIIFFISIGALINQRVGDPHSLDVKANIEWSKEVREKKCLLDPGVIEAGVECEENDKKGRKRVLLWGDSNAASLYPGLRELANQYSFNLTQLTQSACPPLVSLEKLIFNKNCNDVNNYILKKISHEKYDLIILNAAWIHPNYPMTYRELLDKSRLMIDEIKLASPKSRIILISNVPRWYISARKASFKGFGLENSSQDSFPVYALAIILPEIDRTLDRVAREKGVEFISPVENMCVQLGSGAIIGEHPACVVSINNKSSALAYIDWGHLSGSGSRFLVNKIKSQILRELER